MFWIQESVCSNHCYLLCFLCLYKHTIFLLHKMVCWTFISIFWEKMNKYFNTYFILKFFSKRGLFWRPLSCKLSLFLLFLLGSTRLAGTTRNPRTSWATCMYSWEQSGFCSRKLAAKHSIGLLYRIEYRV